MPGSVPEKYAKAVVEAGSLCAEITPPVIAAQINDLTGFHPNYQGPDSVAGIAGLTSEQWHEYGDGPFWDRVGKPNEAIHVHGELMCDLVDDVQALDKVSGETLRLALAAYVAGVDAIEGAHGLPDTPAVRHYVTDIRHSLRRYQPPSDTAGSQGASVAIAFAEEQLGEPYELGAAGPDRWDCSGLTMKAWADAGVTLPRTSRAQAAQLPQIRRDQLQPGDLVYWGHGSIDSIYHVALYMGDGKIIHAPQTGKTVEIQPIDYWIPPSYYTRGAMR